MGKYNFDYNENDYKTPPELYEMALKYFGKEKFNLDTCCSDEHIPSKWYCKFGEIDGLATPWVDYSWCNPPFNECKKWIEKAYNENKDRKLNIAMLLPVRTETKYWHDYILFNPNAKIHWLRKGYKFLNNKGEEMGVFKNALALVYFNASHT